MVGGENCPRALPVAVGASSPGHEKRECPRGMLPTDWTTTDGLVSSGVTGDNP